MVEELQAPQVAAGRWSEAMLAPLDVQKMLVLNALECGIKRVSHALGRRRVPVREYPPHGSY